LVATNVTGEGIWRDGVFDGKAIISLREGRLDDPKHKIQLEGISVDVEFSHLASLRTAPAQVFTWRSGRYDIVPLGVGRIEFEMDQNGCASRRHSSMSSAANCRLVRW
jgi:hypothetical protein